MRTLFCAAVNRIFSSYAITKWCANNQKQNLGSDNYLLVKAVVIIMLLVYGDIISINAQAPAITSFSPASVCQGNNVTITGTDFTGATIVKIDGLAIM